MDAQNNGGYANMWLIGDIKTGEIANYEQGLIYQNLQKKTDGWFFGDNAPSDPRIRNVESTDTGYNDVRQQTGARRVRWPQLLEPVRGQDRRRDRADDARPTPSIPIWATSTRRRARSAPTTTSTRCTTSAIPNAVWNVPFYPAGSVDGKVTTAAAAEEMSMWGRLRPRRRRPVRRRGVPAPAPAMELAGGLSGQPPLAALDAVRGGGRGVDTCEVAPRARVGWWNAGSR